MYGFSAPGETGQRSLHQDDKDGITYLYPSSKNSGISGTIADTDNIPLDSVKVKLKKKKNNGWKKKKKTKSEEDGSFEFTNLKKGKYKIIAKRSGYKKGKKKIELEESEEISVEIEIEEK